MRDPAAGGARPAGATSPDRITQPTSGGGSVRSGLLIAALGFAGLTASLMQTIVIPFLPQLPYLLHTDPSATAWVLTVSLLVAAITMPISGRLADMLGKRRLILILLGFQIVGSVISGLAPDLTLLLVGRALQGAVLGVIAIGIALVHELLPPQKAPTGIALISGTIAIGAGLGLPASALLTQYLSWRAPFVATAALAAVAVIAVVLIVPKDHHPQGGRFDVVGAVTLAATLTGALLVVSQGPVWGWGSPVTLTVGALTVVLAGGWTVLESRVAAPLVDLRVAWRRNVALSNLAAACLGFALFAGNVAIPQLLQQSADASVGFGLDLVSASLVIMLTGLLAMLVSPAAGALIRIHGPRPVLIAGAGLIVIGYGSAAFWNVQVWQLALAAALIGVGIGAGYAALPATLLHSVPRNQTGAANSVNTLLRTIGTAAGSATITTTLAAHTTDGSHDITAAGFQIAFLMAAGIGIAALVSALLLRRTTVV